MERRFDMTDFEQSLKEQVDQLTMIPSKKVWNGIYNNLHPGSNWPSLAMALFFLFTFFGIGHLNNRNYKAADHPDFTNQSEVNESDERSATSQASASSSEKQISFSGEKKIETPIIDLKDNFKGVKSNPEAKITGNKSGTKNVAKVIPLFADKTVLKSSVNSDKSTGAIPGNKIIKESKLVIPESSQNVTSLLNNSIDETGKNANQLHPDPAIEEINYEGQFQLLKTFVDLSALPAKDLFAESGEIDLKDEANKAPNEVKARKRNEKIRWTFYVAPSVTTASFVNKNFQATNSNASSLIIRRNQQPYGMIYNSRFSLHAGAEMSYTFWKKLQFVTGINFSNSGYHVISNQVHPTFAKLTLLEENSGLPYTQSYITHYGNGQSQNQVSLSNYNLRISVPIGLQEALFENNKIRIDFATLMSPGYNFKNQAFLISSDGRYYVQDPDLLRKMNINGNVATYITFKADKIKWQFGPTFSYQLLSTYQKKYPVKEHLIDYGIRIGISR
jgi:hypothetical protein